MQPYRLFQAEEEVHVVDCLAARSLQQVVYHRNDQQLVFLFQQIDQALVRIYHLFQIRVLVGDESERVISVVFFINTLDLIQSDFAIQISRGKDTSREITSHRDKVVHTVEAVLQLP